MGSFTERQTSISEVAKAETWCDAILKAYQKRNGALTLSRRSVDALTSKVKQSKVK